jgi:hypothetical protein
LNKKSNSKKKLKKMVNVNITIPDEIHKKSKIKCAIEEITLKEFIIKAIEEKINEKK